MWDLIRERSVVFGTLKAVPDPTVTATMQFSIAFNHDEDAPVNFVAESLDKRLGVFLSNDHRVERFDFVGMSPMAHAQAVPGWQWWLNSNTALELAKDYHFNIRDIAVVPQRLEDLQLVYNEWMDDIPPQENGVSDQVYRAVPLILMAPEAVVIRYNPHIHTSTGTDRTRYGFRIIFELVHPDQVQLFGCR